MHATTAAVLAAQTDAAIPDIVAHATPVGTGIGGVVATLDVGGVPVFVKSVPLTDLERDPRNLHSTANLFGLPTCCQYGVSSPGFNVWRELATHQMTTAWILSGACPSFPLLYHWRILPRSAATSLTPDEERDVERQFAAWGGSVPIRDRFAARYLAKARVVLFLEYLPHDLRSWLGDAPSTTTVRMVERELLQVTSFMAARGLIHFDAHFENILTDGERLYVSDFGQAVSSSFSLSAEERELFATHRDFDASYVLTALANAVRGSPACGEIVDRYAPIAILMNEFFARLRRDKVTPYPAAELAAARRRARTLAGHG
jgi:hypothetical protein